MQKKRIVLEREKLEFLAAESSNWSIKSGSNLRAAKAIMLQGRDVGNCSDDSIVMADKEKKKKRGNYCAVGGPNMSNRANISSTPGISTHYFPKDETLRQKWIRFVRIHRKDLVPSKSSTLCSVHFEDTCFESKAVDCYFFRDGGISSAEEKVEKGHCRSNKGHGCFFKFATNVAKAKIGKWDFVVSHVTAKIPFWIVNSVVGSHTFIRYYYCALF